MKTLSSNSVQIFRRTPPLVFAMSVLSLGGLIGFISASKILVSGLRPIEDTITVTDAASDTTANSKVDTIQIASGEGFDTINGFVVGSDIIDVSFTGKDDDNGISQGNGTVHVTGDTLQELLSNFDAYVASVPNITYSTKNM